MPVDDDLRRTCNFFLDAPDWAMREEKRGTLVKKLSRIPDDGAMWWLAGIIILANGDEMVAVFSTSSSGELFVVVARVGDEWVEPNDPEFRRRIGLNTTEIFPYDWRFNIPFEKDVFHDRA